MFAQLKSIQYVFILGSLLIASLLPAKTISVKDFGAIGDGRMNDLPAFEAALQAISSKSRVPDTLFVPSGEYRLVPAEGVKKDSHLELSHLKNLVITGESSTRLVFGSPYIHGIKLIRSSNITIRNLILDYDPLPFTQGMITSVDSEGHLIDVQIEAGYPSPTDEHLDITKSKGHIVGYVFDPESPRRLEQFFDQYLRVPVQDLGNGTFRYQSSHDNPVSSEMVGKRFAVIGRRKGNAIEIWDATDCLIEQVSVYSAPACAFGVFGSANVTIDRCKVILKPRTTRTMSTNADGLHSKWCSVGPTLSNSSFTGMGDDSVNVGGSYTPVIEQPDDHTLVVESHGTIIGAPAQLVSFDRKTHGHFELGPVISIRDTKAEGYDRGCLRVTFERPLPVFLTWRDTQNKRKCDQVLNLNACGRGSRILNNHFYNHRVRGVLMRAPDSVISGNHFEALPGPAIVVSNDGGFLSEGPSGNGTIIENNRFTHIQRSNIWINSSVGEKGPDATRGVVDVQILNNTFENYGGVSITGRGEVGNVFYIKNASDLLIRGNRIGSSTVEGTPLILEDTESISWEDNLIHGRPLKALINMASIKE